MSGLSVTFAQFLKSILRIIYVQENQIVYWVALFPEGTGKDRQGPETDQPQGC